MGTYVGSQASCVACCMPVSSSVRRIMQPGEMPRATVHMSVAPTTQRRFAQRADTRNADTYRQMPWRMQLSRRAMLLTLR